jgi:hypothetical protein
LFIGNDSIQSSKFDEMDSMDGSFNMNEGETPEGLCQRLIVVSVAMKDLGSKNADDRWIKRKLISAILPYVGDIQNGYSHGVVSYRQARVAHILWFGL